MSACHPPPRGDFRYQINRDTQGSGIWIKNCWPPNTARVEALARDGTSTYQLPFLVRRSPDGTFRNAETGDRVAVQIIGWRHPKGDDA